MKTNLKATDGTTLRGVHGTADMPVWGWHFRMAEEGSQARAQERINALIDYLQPIQN